VFTVFNFINIVAFFFIIMYLLFYYVFILFCFLFYVDLQLKVKVLNDLQGVVEYVECGGKVENFLEV